MKIRIRGNSLRYRLTRSDVATLGVTGLLEEHIAFAGKPLAYAIEATDAAQLSADYTGERIVLKMPRVMIQELNTTDTVGFNGQSGLVSLLVEKDFTCLEKVEEDQTDHFPNPLLTHA